MMDVAFAYLAGFYIVLFGTGLIKDFRTDYCPIAFGLAIFWPVVLPVLAIFWLCRLLVRIALHPHRRRLLIAQGTIARLELQHRSYMDGLMNGDEAKWRVGVYGDYQPIEEDHDPFVHELSGH